MKKILNAAVEGVEESYWQEQIELQAKSQLSRTVYCQIEKISYNQFVYWSKKLKKKSSVPLIPVQMIVNEPRLSSDVEREAKILCKLNLRDGKHLEIYEQKALLFILEKVL